MAVFELFQVHMHWVKERGNAHRVAVPLFTFEVTEVGVLVVKRAMIMRQTLTKKCKEALYHPPFKIHSTFHFTIPFQPLIPHALGRNGVTSRSGGHHWLTQTQSMFAIHSHDLAQRGLYKMSPLTCRTVLPTLGLCYFLFLIGEPKSRKAL